MPTNDSNSGRGRQISSPLCSPSNRRSWRDEMVLIFSQNTTVELPYLGLLLLHALRIENCLSIDDARTWLKYTLFSTSVSRSMQREGKQRTFSSCCVIRCQWDASLSPAGRTRSA